MACVGGGALLGTSYLYKSWRYMMSFLVQEKYDFIDFAKKVEKEEEKFKIQNYQKMSPTFIKSFL